MICVVVLAFHGHAQAAAWREAKVLCDFETSDWMERFTPKDLTIEYSEDEASQGKASMKVTFAGFRVGHGNRLLYFNLAHLGAANWEGWDALEFDVYNPGSAAVGVSARLIGEVKGRGRKIVAKPGFSAPPGWHRYSLWTRGPHNGGWYFADPNDVDRSKFSTFWIGIRDRNPQNTVLYIDNIRLVNRIPARLRAIGAALKRIDTARRRMGGQMDEAAERNEAQLRRLISKSDFLLKNALAAEQAQQIEDTVPQVDVLHKQAVDLVEVMSRDMVRMVAMAFDFSVGANGSRLISLEETREIPQLRSLRALEQLNEILADEVSQARLQASVGRQFADQDFAIGIPDSPRAWHDRPQDYSGLLRKEVSVSAARHEYEPFQLVLLTKDKALSKVSIEASALTGPGTIEAEHIEIAPMGWQWFSAEQRWLAVMLRPDIKIFDVEVGAQQPVWVNVYVPKNTPPGEYHGTLTISGEGMQSQEVTVKLTVWPFTLPRFPSMKSAGAGGMRGEHADEYVRFLIAHRWNCHRLYLQGARSFSAYTYDNFKKWHQWGGTFFNLYWISHGRGGIETGPDGRKQASIKAKSNVFQVLDPIINDIKNNDPGFLKEFVVYGFDEPSPSQMPALEDMFGALKQRYGPNLKTYFATHIPMWDDYGIAKNIDIWAVQPSDMTAEARDRLRAAGRQILAYNIMGEHKDPVRTRVQFWSYFKDQFDGVLHYNPHKAGEGTPIAGPWEPTLFPRTKRTDGGLQRRLPGGGLLMSTIAFEFWREGLEDVDYLHVLRDLRDKLANAAHAGGADYRRLLREADRMVNVPETITTGCLAGRSESSGEIIKVIHGTTTDMGVILDARRQVAHLILKIQEQLTRADK